MGSPSQSFVICSGDARPAKICALIAQNSSRCSGVIHKEGLTGVKSSSPIPLIRSLKVSLKSPGNNSPILENIWATSSSLASASENSGNSESMIPEIIALASPDMSPKNALASSLWVIELAILSARASVCSWSAKASAPTPKFANISTIELFICSWSASSPQMESLRIAERLETPPSVTKPAATSPTVSNALQIALPIISQILINSFTRIAIINSDIASFKAANRAARMSDISPTQANGLTSLGSVMSSIFLQNGNSKSLIKSNTLGLKSGGLGQSIAIIAFEINLAPGKRFSWSTNSKRLSA